MKLTRLTPAYIKKFRRKIYAYYRKHGRHTLLWRKTRDPYRILVSEIMLQQTQVSRVEKKYQEFIKKFPTVTALARSSQGDVVRAWSGLGYNRRALFLHALAKVVVSKHGGRIPGTVLELEKLPGVGHATARALCAFAYNLPFPFIETNIRSVFLRELDAQAQINLNKTDMKSNNGPIHDRELFYFIEETLDRKNPREWYYALMDYGVMLKKKYGNPNARSAQYVRQSQFKGSNREIRGKILKILKNGKGKTVKEIMKQVGFAGKDVFENIRKLRDEGFLAGRENIYALR